MSLDDGKRWVRLDDGKRWVRLNVQMVSGDAIDLGRYAVMLTLTLSLPVLGAALIVGLVVSTLQAVTQIQEHTLSFVPKIIAVLLAGALAGPWMVAKVVEFACEMFGPMP